MTAKSKRIIRTAALVLLIPPVLIFALFGVPLILIGVGVWMQRSPAMPQITYAEFPFALTYEVNGEVFTVEDVYICEYDGLGANSGSGKYREWNGYIKGTGEDGIVLKQVEESGDVSAEYTIYVGSAEFYMGDWDTDSMDTETSYAFLSDPILEEAGYDLRAIDPLTITCSSTTELENGSQLHSFRPVYEEELEELGIRILKWEYSEPIINSFERRKFFWF